MNIDFGSYYYTQLAQARPANTSTNTLYAKPANTQVFVTSILLANVTASDATYSIFWDADGTTYTTDTAIAYNVTLAANGIASLEFENPIPLVVNGAFGIQSGTSGAITYTLSGFIRNVQ